MTRVAIVGAGTAGLTAHLALSRHDVDIDHVERRPVFEDVGGNYIIWPNAGRVLARLGLSDFLPRHGATLNLCTTFDHRGDPISREDLRPIAARHDMPVYVVTRYDLQSSLLEAIGRDSITMGAECVATHTTGSSATVGLADGRTIDADLIVAADGSRSALRAGVSPGAGTEYVGISYWTGWFVDPDFLARHSPHPDGFTEYCGPGRRIAMFPSGGGRVGFVFVVRAPESLRPDSAHEYMRESLHGFPEPVDALLTRLESENLIHWPIYDIQNLDRWHSTRTVLVGDAAHASAPTLGQGTNMAIEDGWVLGEEIGAADGDIDAALARFSARRRSRTGQLVRMSRERALAATETDPTLWRSAMEHSRATGENLVWSGVAQVVDGGPLSA